MSALMQQLIEFVKNRPLKVKVLCIAFLIPPIYWFGGGASTQTDTLNAIPIGDTGLYVDVHIITPIPFALIKAIDIKNDSAIFSTFESGELICNFLLCNPCFPDVLNDTRIALVQILKHVIFCY